MNLAEIYDFIAGSSRVTPIGLAIAVAIALFAHSFLGIWAAPVYLGILALTLILSTFEMPT
ncbi:MAG: hypothetical protein M3Y21_01515 [Candidatus Eremiobacteraeota bacterium]|nr:hypothetical protein [Candidatus Eremiobacteraeota bacterium]